MSCDGYCSVALPHGGVSWSVVFACGISRSYSLALLIYVNRLLDSCEMSGLIYSDKEETYGKKCRLLQVMID